LDFKAFPPQLSRGVAPRATVSGGNSGGSISRPGWARIEGPAIVGFMLPAAAGYSPAMGEIGKRPAGDRNAGLDALRGIAIAAVVGFHYWAVPTADFRAEGFIQSLFAQGWRGVDLFFILSGYLLGGQLLDNRGRPAALTVFYVRRAARILPLYLLLLGIMAALFPTGEQWPLLTMTQNIWWAIGYPINPSWAWPTWSLAVEEQFYLLLPALIFLTPVGRLPVILLAMAAGSFLLRAHFFHVGNVAAATYLPFCHLDSLGLGVFVAWYARRRALAPVRLPVPRPLAWLGQRSYCVYLFHLPLGALGAHVAGSGLAQLSQLALSDEDFRG
jgi:peptidoglycan/LPS O-acetylase OafA/YrhL